MIDHDACVVLAVAEDTTVYTRGERAVSATRTLTCR